MSKKLKHLAQVAYTAQKVAVNDAVHQLLREEAEKQQKRDADAKAQAQRDAEAQQKREAEAQAQQEAKDMAIQDKPQAGLASLEDKPQAGLASLEDKPQAGLAAQEAAPQTGTGTQAQDMSNILQIVLQSTPDVLCEAVEEAMIRLFTAVTDTPIMTETQDSPDADTEAVLAVGIQPEPQL